MRFANADSLWKVRFRKVILHLAMIRRRQQAAIEYNMLDSRPEPAIQELVALASLVCSTPISCLSFVDWDARRVLTRARVGITNAVENVSFDDCPPENFFCLQCIRDSDPADGGAIGTPLLVTAPDQHPNFSNNPYVRQGIIKFYLGVALITPSGTPIGSLCVVDSKPRGNVSAGDVHTLTLLARQIMSHLEYQQENRILKNTLAEREALRLRLRQVLGGMLPSHVIASIKRGLKPPADHFDSVTVFFSDIVGFKQICDSLPPTTLLHMLDTLYSAMDRLVTKHGLFKVETIGDVFVCCGGMLEPQDDHTLRVAKFAVDAVEAASKVPIDPNDLSRGYVSIRVGFHTGPVVASVVGMSRPRYCLFGDTVNTAARMQTASHAERINMSPAAAAALRSQCPHVRLEERPPMFIKGKGEMVMSFLDPSSLAFAITNGDMAVVQAKCVEQEWILSWPQRRPTAAMPTECILGSVA
ncbi:unnamed protein product [Aphanomyces euteiches]